VGLSALKAPPSRLLLCYLYQPQHSANRAKDITSSRHSRGVKIFKRKSDAKQVVTVTWDEGVGWDDQHNSSKAKLSLIWTENGAGT
jgi:hypothetical protein